MRESPTPSSPKRRARPGKPAAPPATVATGQPAAATQAYEIADNVARQATLRPARREPGDPHTRPLRIFALDPSLSTRAGSVATVDVPYERLDKGPIGALFEVDWRGAPKDPFAKGVAPLDLELPHLLMQRGLPPTPANPQFHLQMVYAVCSLTYDAFRRALGREIAWTCAAASDGGAARLVLRPFGLRDPNAGFSRETGDIVFGYFNAGADPAGFTVSKGLVCTALSHDIIAHETTHALLDGLRPSFDTPSNPDVPAFHEGFADLVALFLHFTYADVVEQSLRESRGAIAHATLLAGLAQEFGYARSREGRGAALRSAVDVAGLAAYDSDIPAGREGGPRCYDPTLEPHALGSVLVSAVFEAFTTIVRRKTERLFGIAGLDPATLGTAALSDALLRAIAREASEIAGQFLRICIRAVDYCPPADIRLGEYLRALITADSDLVRDDPWGYREALMRSFRRRRIFPEHVPFMTEDAVRWEVPDIAANIPGLSFSEMRFAGDPGHPADADELARQAHCVGRFVSDPDNARALHLVAPGSPFPKGVTYASPLRVESVRVTRRVAPDERVVFDLVAEVTQSCTVDRQGELFDIVGGATIVVDPQGMVRYAVFKKMDSTHRQSRQHAAMQGPLRDLWHKSGNRWAPYRDVLKRVHAHR